jgi:hypothetical protein
MTLETCKICDTLDKRGTHEECEGIPDAWKECNKCLVFDDIESHTCLGMCSTCGKWHLMSSMTDLTRIGYDPCMVYECAECTTNGKVNA